MVVLNGRKSRWRIEVIAIATMTEMIYGRRENVLEEIKK